jgi:hypothetical protein
LFSKLRFDSNSRNKGKTWSGKSFSQSLCRAATKLEHGIEIIGSDLFLNQRTNQTGKAARVAPIEKFTPIASYTHIRKGGEEFSERASDCLPQKLPLNYEFRRPARAAGNL